MDIDPQSSQFQSSPPPSSSSSSSRKNSPHSSASFVSSESLTSSPPAAFSFLSGENSPGKSFSQKTSTLGSSSNRFGYSRSSHRVRDSPIQKRKFSLSSGVASSTGKNQASTSELMDHHRKKQPPSWQQTKSHSFSSGSSLNDQMANLHIRDISKQRSSLPADPKASAAAASSSSASSFKLGDVIDKIFSEAFNDSTR